MQRIVTILDTALTVNYNDRPISTQKDLDTYKFEFDDSWQGYVKTAVFYTDRAMVKHLLIPEDGVVTIPWEILIGKPKALYIGAFGTKDTKVKPTTFGAVRLREGSYIDGVAPLPPTPDVYQQIISAWEDAKTEETERVANENSRRNNFDALVIEYNALKAELEQQITDGTASVDALQVLEADYAAKALALETTYAPRLGSVESQLAEIPNKPYIRGVNSIQNIVSFYLDDGYKKDIELALPVAVAENIPVTVACIANPLNTSPFMSVAEILDLQNNHGWEISSHTVSHTDLRSLTEAELDIQFGDSKKYFESVGIKTESICYPLGYYNQLVMDVARKYYRCGLASIQSFNKSPIDTYRLSRILINDFTIDQLKSKVDAMVNTWYIFYSHTNTWVQADIDKFTAIVQYVKSKSIPITTISQGLDIYENKLEVNSVLEGKKAAIGADGTTEFTDIASKYLGGGTGITNATPISAFPKYKVSVVSLIATDNSLIPFSGGIGTLTTSRLSNNDELSYQIFKEYNTALSHVRVWLVGGWGAWSDLQPVTIPTVPTVINGTPLNATVIKNGTPITSFPINKISYVTFISGQSDFPYSSSIGTLITCRLSNNDALAWQEWHEYNTTKVYRRTWSGSAWGVWQQVVAFKVNTLIANAFGNIPANGSVVFNIPVTGLETGGTINCTFVSELPTGLLVGTSCPSVGSLRMKMYNVTAAIVNASSRSFYIAQV